VGGFLVRVRVCVCVREWVRVCICVCARVYVGVCIVLFIACDEGVLSRGRDVLGVMHARGAARRM